MTPEQIEQRDVQNVPLALQRTLHWIVWRYEENPKKGKPDKVPYNPRSTSHERPWRASVSKPSSWGTFGEALRALQSGFYTGVGFVFHESDPFWGIDLDHCLDEETHQLNAWAQAIVEQINSYSEWSPSGTGIHILAQATLLVAGINRKGVGLEMYSSGRFFTITGKHVAGSPEDVLARQEAVTSLYETYAVPQSAHTQEENDEELHREIGTPTAPVPLVSEATDQQKPERGRKIRTPDDLSDDELLEKAMNPERADGRDFARLWHGDKSGFVHRHGDQKGQIDDSLADYALCRMLAFWTGKNAARMDRLFRQSSLLCQKWDTPSRGYGTYGQRTIDRAIANCKRTYDPMLQSGQRGKGQRGSAQKG